MIDWIYETNLGELAIWAAIVSVGFAWLGTILLRPIFRLFVRSRAGSNDIVGNVMSNFGVLYGILLGLTAVAAYQNWSQVDSNATTEAGSMLALFQEVSTYPAPYREELRTPITQLCSFTVEQEWPQLKKGAFPTGARPMVDAIQRTLLTFEPQTKTQEIVHAEVIGRFNRLLEQRRYRIYSMTSGIPSVLWYVVIVGAIINILLVWLLDMRLVTQLFLGGVLAFFLGAMILLIARLDKPFKSEDGVSPTALQTVCQFMAKS